MKASELIIYLRALVRQYGDLDTIVDSDSIPLEIDSVSILTEPYSPNPVFLISPLQDSVSDINLDSINKKTGQPIALNNPLSADFEPALVSNRKVRKKNGALPSSMQISRAVAS